MGDGCDGQCECVREFVCPPRPCLIHVSIALSLSLAASLSLTHTALPSPPYRPLLLFLSPPPAPYFHPSPCWLYPTRLSTLVVASFSFSFSVVFPVPSRSLHGPSSSPERKQSIKRLLTLLPSSVFFSLFFFSVSRRIEKWLQSFPSSLGRRLFPSTNFLFLCFSILICFSCSHWYGFLFPHFLGLSSSMSYSGSSPNHLAAHHSGRCNGGESGRVSGGGGGD